MSTLRPSSRLLTVLAQVGLGLTLAGCSATSGNRTGAMSKMKTFLAVGDKPLPVVTGEPGSSVSAETNAEPVTPSRTRARLDGKISGRVFDVDNRPVPDARVRLAVSGAPGGKVVTASTDASGAFTLHGLRPGSSYTVIAEVTDDQGVMTGRAEDVRTSDADVRISLGAEGASNARASAPSRINRVSERAAAEEEPEPAPKGRTHPKVNEEDLPPAAEAEAFAPSESSSASSRASVSTRRSRPGTSETWRRGAAERSADAAEPAAETEPRDLPRAVAAPVDPETHGTGAPADEAASSPYDEGPNPLPPALEPAEDGSASTNITPRRGSPVDPAPLVAARPDRDAGLEPTRQPAASSPFESPSSPTVPPVSTPPTDAAPGALVVVPETYAPVAIHDETPVSHQPEPAPAPREEETPSPPVHVSRQGSGRAVAPKRAAATEKPVRRPTWGEVASTVKTVPPLETDALSDSGGRDAKADPGVARRALTKVVREPNAEKTAATPKDEDGTVAMCDYDDRHRRIADFRLPDLDGKAVRFKDIDADLVLIDFWGTWCQPCLKSIPHLVSLQERMGNRLAIIGIACESDAPDKSAAKVAATVKRLKVNYPVLLSRNDGSCPLQEALHVQAFPTMILVDREGRVLWRDQGATSATLARLDRFLDASPKADDTRRY